MAIKVSASASLSVRANLAGHHLRASHIAAMGAFEIERAHQNEAFGSWYEDLLVWVPTAIVMAGAALEASANELIQDILDKPAPFSLTNERIMDLHCLKRDRSGNSMSRYRAVAKICARRPDEGSLPWQNAQLLVKCRNEFMHFKPAWVSESSDDDRDVVEELKKKVPVSRVYRGESLVFPHSFITYGHAKWALQTVLSFSAYFANLLGVPDKFASSGRNLALP